MMNEEKKGDKLKEKELEDVTGGFAIGGTTTVVYILTYRDHGGTTRTKEISVACADTKFAYSSAQAQASTFLRDIGGTFISLKKK